MQNAQSESGKTIDIGDTGTAMRFLTAYFATTGDTKIITGSDRMKQRPIGVLVKALNEIGAQILYLEKDGYPPIEIKGSLSQLATEIEIQGNISSQYISALMMIAPVLPKGLVLHIKGTVLSKPYIHMTASLMKLWGVTCEWEGQSIKILHSTYKPTNYSIETDWSAISYWFAFVAASNEAEVVIPNIFEKSLQGDIAIIALMDQLGVKAKFDSEKLTLTKKNHSSTVTIDFKDYPDLAQTVIPLAALKKINGTFTGLESLRIKETDRVKALQNELIKIGAVLSTAGNHTWVLNTDQVKFSNAVSISTYDDHRMAMGFACWAAQMNLSIEKPEVVDKSYPNFWNDLKSLGIEIT